MTQLLTPLPTDWLRRLCVLVACLVSSACTVVSGNLGVSYQNRADVKGDFVSTSQPVPRSSMDWRSDKPNFVGLAISGGGSRAANFGMAVLGELQEQGILQHVDAISAVSGGSIPTAYFALHGDKPNWQSKAREVAATNFLSAFLFKLVNPLNFSMTTFTDKDRSDLLAEVFQENVLGGALKFSDLGPRGPLRPSVFFNATDTTNGGERFVFTDDRFFERLGSLLHDYPLAWAMASSGAFPGVFNSVTLRRFSIDPEVRKTEESFAAKRHYVHLIDGGSTDNFGTSTLIDLARQHHVNALNKGRVPEGCLIMVADSHVPNAAIAEANASDRRNRFSVIIDLNFLDAIDAMLGTRRIETLQAMGIKKHEALGRFSIRLDEQMIEYNVRPYQRVSSFQINYYEQDGRALVRPNYAGLSDSFDFSGIRKASAKSFTCTAWHIALEDIDAVVPWKQVDGKSVPLNLRDETDQRTFAYRGKLSRVIKQLQTNYKLDGPPNCKADFLQQSLYDAAHIAVREDKPSVDAICRWFGDRKLLSGEQCRVSETPLVREPYEVYSLSVDLDQTRNSQQTNRFVQCRQ